MVPFLRQRRNFLSHLMFSLATVGVALPMCAVSAFSDEPDAKNRVDPTKPDEDAALAKRWNQLTHREAAEITRRNIHGLVRAAHLYAEKHGSLPPAVIANPKLPAGKRLSGFVLLLPYLKADSWSEKGKPCFDSATVKLANDVYEMIDQTKAWDDPVNLKAAKTILPPLLAPQSGGFRDEAGFALAHFAFVRGSRCRRRRRRLSRRNRRETCRHQRRDGDHAGDRSDHQPPRPVDGGRPGHGAVWRTHRPKPDRAALGANTNWAASSPRATAILSAPLIEP